MRARLLLLPLLLAGCVVQPTASDPNPAPTPPRKEDTAAIYLDAVQGLIDKEQYFAAIAHIQEDRRTQGDSPQLRLLEADARARLGQREAAQKLYLGLLEGSTAADAHHGLGRLAATQGDLKNAIGWFKRAATLKPVDVSIRNDLGFALLQAGRYPEARTELATAVELAPGESKSRNNLIILLIAQGDEAALQRVLNASPGVDAALLARLRLQAQSLKSKSRS